MSTTLYLCIKNPFTERDLDRMGIVELSQHFDLRILDCTAWLMPTAFRTRETEGIDHPARILISSLAQFKTALGDGGYAIDYVGQFSPRAILMFDALRRRNIKLAVIDSGAHPVPDIVLGRRGRLCKLWDALRHGGLRGHVAARINRVLLRLLPDQRPDLALVAGDSWRNVPRFTSARRHVPAHSFDYEVFRKVRGRADRAAPQAYSDYAVYLDEDIAHHEDNAEMGLADPASEERFYPALNRLFRRFEKETGLRVVIAGYPSRRRGTAERFPGRPVVFGRTAELVRDSSIVFAHASTAVSYAVLWRRPLVFLTSGEIAASWYAPRIEAPRVLLKAPLLSVDEDWALPAWKSVDEAAYATYANTFLKAPGSPDEPLWEIFRQAATGGEAVPP